MKLAQSVREELIEANSEHVLVVLSVKEQLEEDGVTPIRPGREGEGRRFITHQERGVGGEGVEEERGRWWHTKETYTM